MRNSNDPSKVMMYQLAIYTGIPLPFFINGLLNTVNIKSYSPRDAIERRFYGIYDVSGNQLYGLISAGLIMSFGLYWANRDYLVALRPIKHVISIMV
jgi:YQGE family putative transporter